MRNLHKVQAGQGVIALGTPGGTPDRILLLLRENPSLAIPDLAAETGKSESTIEPAMRRLREQNRLQRVGPAKGGAMLVAPTWARDALANEGFVEREVTAPGRPMPLRQWRRVCEGDRYTPANA